MCNNVIFKTLKPGGLLFKVKICLELGSPQGTLIKCSTMDWEVSQLLTPLFSFFFLILKLKLFIRQLQCFFPPRLFRTPWKKIFQIQDTEFPCHHPQPLQVPALVTQSCPMFSKSAPQTRGRQQVSLEKAKGKTSGQGQSVFLTDGVEGGVDRGLGWKYSEIML